MSEIKKIGIFCNKNTYSEEIYQELIIKLKNKGYVLDNDDFDLGIAIGGDGSFLRMAKRCEFNSRPYYVGINTGTLGFAQEIYPNEINDFLTMVEEDDYKVEDISIGESNIYTKDNCVKHNFLNEITIRDKNLKSLHLDIQINKEPLEAFVGDGIMISTSFGSTAYNLSFGGSIVYSDLHILQLTPIAPINNKSYRTLQRSVIIPEERKILITPRDEQNVLITTDGEIYYYDDISSIDTSVRNEKIKCLRMKDYDYTRRIYEKFVKD